MYCNVFSLKFSILYLLTLGLKSLNLQQYILLNKDDVFKNKQNRSFEIGRVPSSLKFY